MTDHPRFEPIRGAPDAAHLDYNGGRLVDAVLKLIDWWLAPRESAPPSARVTRAMAEGCVMAGATMVLRVLAVAGLVCGIVLVELGTHARGR